MHVRALSHLGVWGINRTPIAYIAPKSPMKANSTLHPRGNLAKPMFRASVARKPALKAGPIVDVSNPLRSLGDISDK